jgi:hypothetical protein
MVLSVARTTMSGSGSGDAAASACRIQPFNRTERGPRDKWDAAGIGPGQSGQNQDDRHGRDGNQDGRRRRHPSFKKGGAIMRSTENTLSFRHPFRLSPLDRAQPAGQY